jgi:hypothetical protein
MFDLQIDKKKKNCLKQPERVYANKHCVFHCNKSKTIHGGTPVQTIKYYDHIVLLYLESRRCRYLSIIFVCFYLHVTVVNFIDYSDMDKMMDIDNDKC